MRELQGEWAPTVNIVGLNKPQGQRPSKSKQKKTIKKGKKKTKASSIKIIGKDIPLVINPPADNLSYDDCLVIRNRGVSVPKETPTYSSTKRKCMVGRKIVLTLFEDDVQVISSTQDSPETRRVTRSMVKEKGHDAQKEMSPILVDDSSNEPLSEPLPDFSRDNDCFQSVSYLSPVENYQQTPPQRPSTPLPLMSAEKDFSLMYEGSAEIQLSYARLQRKHQKLKMVLKEYKVLTKVIHEENTKYRE